MLFLLYLGIILISLFISIYNSNSTNPLAQKVQEKLTATAPSILFSDLATRSAEDTIRTNETEKEPFLSA